MRRTAAGAFYSPAGRRHLGVVVVRTCPACGPLHLHRAESRAVVDGAVRAGSCGATYRLALDAAAGLGGAR